MFSIRVASDPESEPYTRSSRVLVVRLVATPAAASFSRFSTCGTRVRVRASVFKVGLHYVLC